MRKDTVTRSFLICAILLMSVTSRAPSQSVVHDETQDEIVVTGVRPGAEPIRNQAIAFVRMVSARPVDGQIARWHVPVCPNVKGLSTQHAAIVVQSVKQIARTAGAETGGATCRPNIVITFTSKASGLMKLLLKRQPSVFSQVDRDDRSELIDSDRAVRWWYSTNTEGSDGRQISTSSAALLNSPDFPAPRSGKFLDSYHSTLIGTKINVNLRSVGVVVDVDTASGSTLSSLSSYIAMVALAPAKLRADYSDLPSILAMFSPREVSHLRVLTEWDRAYLSSVYKVPTDRTSKEQRSLIAKQIIKQIDK